MDEGERLGHDDSRRESETDDKERPYEPGPSIEPAEEQDLGPGCAE